MNIVFGIIIGLVVLMALVVAHEFGHFIASRRNGVNVKEFGIGFPPRAIAWRRNPNWKKGNGEKKWLRLPKSEWSKPQDTLVFSINYLPIGGFCSMDGESDADTRKGTFGAASFWAKTKILFGGVIMNWLVAFVLLTILSLFGMPQFIENQFYLGNDAEVEQGGVLVAGILDDSPAAKAGFQVDDKIVKVGDSEVSFPTDVTDFGSEHAGKTVNYIVERGGEEVVLEAELNDNGADYVLGVKMGYGQTYIRSTWSAPIVGAGLTLQLTGETFRGLGSMVWNFVSGVFSQFSADSTVRESGQAAISAAGDSVSGPVGIIGVLFPSVAESGVANLTFLAALISVSLACMNVLPIPALDGGRWLMIALFRLRGKKLEKETEEKIVSRAFMVLMILIVLITILDITRLF